MASALPLVAKAVVGGIATALVSSALSKKEKKPESAPPAPVPEPPVIDKVEPPTPTPQPEQPQVRRRSIAAQARRGGRESTILTSALNGNGEEKLGG